MIGGTGAGKSTLLEAMVRQDMAAGRGLMLLDPHGDLAERLREGVPACRAADLVWFDAPDAANAPGFNPLARVPPAKAALAASGMVEVFKKIWADSWGPRMEHILRNALLVLFDQPEATLADVPRLLADKGFRKSAAARTANGAVRDFWLREYEGYPARFRAEAIAPVQNKVGAFLADPLLHRVLTRRESSFDPRRAMDEGKIVLANLAKGRIGEAASSLLGALLVSRTGLAALGRADAPEGERRDFHLYLDEFQNFTTLALANMLPELRKYRVGLVLAHQHLSQLAPEVRDAVLGNAGTTVCFRLGAVDAEALEGEFSPEFRAEDLVSLPNHAVCVKLMVDGRVSRPFSGETLNPLRRLL